MAQQRWVILLHDVWDCNLKKLKTWNDLLVGAWNSLEVPSIMCLAIDAGHLLGPQVNCKLRHQYMSSPCGFPTWANLGSFIAWMPGSETKWSKRTWWKNKVCIVSFWNILFIMVVVAIKKFISGSNGGIQTPPLNGRKVKVLLEACEIQDIATAICGKY